MPADATLRHTATFRYAAIYWRSLFFDMPPLRLLFARVDMPPFIRCFTLILCWRCRTREISVLFILRAHFR